MQSRAKKEKESAETKDEEEGITKKKVVKMDKPVASKPTSNMENTTLIDADEPRPAVTSDEEEESGSDKAARRAAKETPAAKAKRRQTTHEIFLTAELDTVRSENEALKAGKSTAADTKLNSQDRQALPLLVMEGGLGYKSGNDFRTTATGNLYTDHQIIAHLTPHKPRQGLAEHAQGQEAFKGGRFNGA
jgi:hypothetical protein